MNENSFELYLKFLSILHYDKNYAASMFSMWCEYVEKIIRNSYYFFDNQDEIFQEFVDFVDHNGFLVSRIPAVDGSSAFCIMRE